MYMYKDDLALNNCYGDIYYHNPKMDSSNLNIIPSMLARGRQLLVSYETFDRQTATRERLLLLLHDFLFFC